MFRWEIPTLKNGGYDTTITKRMTEHFQMIGGHMESNILCPVYGYIIYIYIYVCVGYHRELRS